MVQQKDTAIAKQQRRAMAQLLEARLNYISAISPYDVLLTINYYSKAKMNLRAFAWRTLFVRILPLSS